MMATIDGLQVIGTPEEIYRFKEISDVRKPDPRADTMSECSHLKEIMGTEVKNHAKYL